MTDYNDGKWHGWNGGECPVHPKSDVRIWDCASGQDIYLPAEAVHWTFRGAFRVVKEYREPREWWIVNGSVAMPTLSGAEALCEGNDGYTITHVVEKQP